MNDEGRLRSGSLKEKFDGFFTRRPKAKHVADETDPSKNSTVHVDPSTAMAEIVTPHEVGATQEHATPQSSAIYSSDETAPNEATSPEPKPHGGPSQNTDSSLRKASPPLLSEASLDATTSSLNATNREGSKLKMSFTDALAQLARKHGVYYTEGSIRKPSGGSEGHHCPSIPSVVDKSIIHKEIVWWMYDSTQQPTAAKWHHRHHRSEESCGRSTTPAAASSNTGVGVVREWMGSEPPNSLLLLASMSHRPHIARSTLQVEDVKILEHIQWPLVSAVAGLAQTRWKHAIQRHLEDPRRWVPEVDQVMHEPQVVTSQEGTEIISASQRDDVEEGQHESVVIEVSTGDRSEVLVHNSEATVAAAVIDVDGTAELRHETHFRHRLLDFFERYDPQRMPSPTVVSEVVHCGIPEQTLFEFLRSRYGLSASAPQMFLSSGGGHERVPSTHQHVQAHVSATIRLSAGDLASPLGLISGASPDFCLLPSVGDTSHIAEGSIVVHSESVTTHPPHGGLPSRLDSVVATDHWPGSWTTAVAPLVPASVEVVLDGATWNSTASKPGLANPRTTFATASVPTQLFTYNGVTMELSHEAMEATTILSRSSLHSDRTVENVAELVVYPKSQAAALRAHRHSAQCSNGDSADASTSNEVLDALDATLRSSTKTLASPSHQPLSGGGRRRRRGGVDEEGSDSLGDHFARAMLDSTLSWSKHVAPPPPLTPNKQPKPASRRHVIWQHPVALPFPDVDGIAGSGHRKELVLFLEDHWDLDDVDLRPAQSPLSFL
jgi:hypothetical protein